MKRILLLGAFLLLVPSLCAQEPVDLSPAIDQLFPRKDAPGCAVAVIKEGRIIHKRGYGMANLDFDIPISPATVFNVASLSKQFTAMSIALLAQQGKISLDDDIRKYVSEIPDYGTPITIRELVYHTSGIRDYTDLIELSSDRIENVHTDKDILDILARQKKLNFKPGERFLYSNSGYVLLGVIVERVSGRSLRDFETEFIFRPLGMKNTFLYDDRTMIVKNRATGYVSKGDGVYKTRASLWDRVGDGGMLTTVEDLFLWDQNFYAPKVGNVELIKLLTTPGKLANGENLAYAFGLELSRYKGLPIVMHGGSINGFRAQMYRFPEQRFSVVCLCNNGSISPTSIIEKVADLYLADHFKSTRAADSRSASPSGATVNLSEKDLARFAGVFANSSGEFARRVYIKGGKLWFAVTEEEEYELAAFGDNRFKLLGIPEKIELVVTISELGRPSRMSLIIEDGTPRVYEYVQAAPQPSARFGDYVGSYYSEELETNYSLTLKGTKLLVRKKGGNDLVLSPQFDDVFGNHDSLTSIKFTRRQDGQLAGFLLNTSRMKGLVFRKL